jgi:hypothetical protein
MPWQAWKVEWALSQASNQTGPCEWTWKSTGGEWKERESTSGAGPTMHGCAVERALPLILLLQVVRSRVKMKLAN